MALGKERIRCTANKIRNLEKQLQHSLDDFKHRFQLNKEMEGRLKEHLHNIHNGEHKRMKRRQIKKLNNLMAKEKSRTPSNTINDNWICNLSKHTLTEAEHSILSRGLNYAISPKKIPHEEFILATELASERIQDQGQKAALRNEIGGILKTAILPPSNISKKEAEAIHTLQNNTNITILPADKGRTTVILDTEKYEKQMKNMLQDNNTYEVLKKNPTDIKKNKLRLLLKPLLDDGKLDKQTYNHLIPTANITPRIYGTPKIHKPRAPLRPIVDSIGSVTYNLSKYLANIIKPLLGNTEQHCENSKQLVKELKNLKLERTRFSYLMM